MHTGAPTDVLFVRGVDIGCLLATSDNEIGKIGPVPKGCGENPRSPQRRLLVAGVEIRPYFVLALDGGPAAACRLGLV